MNNEDLLRILILEDNIDDAGLLHFELKKLSFPYEVRIADCKEQYEYLVEDFRPNIVLGDYNIPGYNVFEALNLARQQDELIPFIVISGVVGESKIVEAMLNGVNDCIMKDKIVRLIPSIEREIREVKNKRKQLSEHNELTLYKKVFKNSSNAIAILDTKGNYIEQNSAHEKLHGYSQDEIKNKTIANILGAENYEHINSSLNAEGYFNGEISYKNKTGKTIHLDFSSFTIKDGRDKTIHYVFFEKDISEKIIVENEKQKINQKLETLISNLPGIVYRCNYDENWTMFFLSDAVLPITGYTKYELINNATIAFNKLIHPDDREYVKEVIKNAVAKKDDFSVYYRLHKKDGKIIWLWEKGTVIYDSSNNPQYIEGYMEDITLERQSMLNHDE